EMEEQTLARLGEAEVFIASAAVADRRPKTVARQKVKKGAGDEALTLVRTPDILAEASRRSRGARRPLLVGFAAETERVVEHAQEKLARKGLDLIAANDVTEPGAGFAAGTNRLTLVDRTGEVTPLPPMSKEDAAHALLDRLVALRQSAPKRKRRG
ncbi:MAG: phosphopantothenoylcysteine decarboxylase, partial [Myxococcales bacterium]